MNIGVRLIGVWRVMLADLWPMKELRHSSVILNGEKDKRAGDDKHSLLSSTSAEPRRSCLMWVGAAHSHRDGSQTKDRCAGIDRHGKEVS